MDIGNCKSVWSRRVVQTNIMLNIKCIAGHTGLGVLRLSRNKMDIGKCKSVLSRRVVHTNVIHYIMCFYSGTYVTSMARFGKVSNYTP
jgi:hypothetical protein